MKHPLAEQCRNLMRYLTDEERKMASSLSQNEQIFILHSLRMIGGSS